MRVTLFAWGLVTATVAGAAVCAWRHDWADAAMLGVGAVSFAAASWLAYRR
jgi:hypothetical protein